MKHNPDFTKLLLILLFLNFLFAQPTVSYARDDHDEHHGHQGHSDWDNYNRHYYNYGHNRPSFGLRVSFLPYGSISINVGKSKYYYCDGVYYTRHDWDYVVVPAPVGVIVRSLPADCNLVYINGIPYYTNNGIYYIYTTQGYQVVPQPTVIASSTMLSTTYPIMYAPPSLEADQSFTLNIPNSKGSGYTAVLIKRSGNGFVGPQGEFYAEFPRIEQLRVMYSKG